MALAPVPAPIGIHPSFIATRPETIVLKEKVFSLTGDDFHIKLANGTPILRVAGKVFSISGRKKVYDMAGNWLFDIIKERLHIHSTYKVISGGAGNAQQELMVVKSSFKLFGSKATARFTSLNGKSEALSMRGNWWDTSADILDEAQGNLPVARIDRKILSGKDLFFGQQTYAVQIAPGVDMALIAAVCICFDENNNEK